MLRTVASTWKVANRLSRTLSHRWQPQNLTQLLGSPSTPQTSIQLLFHPSYSKLPRCLSRNLKLRLCSLIVILQLHHRQNKANSNIDIRDIAPTFCLDLEKGSRSSNPYIDYIVPLAFRTPCLLYAVLSITFCQQYIRSGARERLHMGLKCRGVSMRLLQQSLNSRNSALEAGTLVCILMLMHYEVMES